MPKLFEGATGISNQWSLAAFAIAAILYIILKRRGKVPAIAWACIVAIVLLGLVPIVASVYVEKARLTDNASAIYRLRITVVDLQQMPVDDARVWSSVGGEAKKVAGGWQFDIPAAAKPADGKLTVYASVASAFLTGRRDLQLTEERNPPFTILLAKDDSATIRGRVVDGSGKAVTGARVSVTGYEREGVVTEAGGNFVLPAHAASGQQVQLHTEKAHYAAVSQWHLAGDEPATLVLDRK
jgi:hypothetical protein